LSTVSLLLRVIAAGCQQFGRTLRYQDTVGVEVAADDKRAGFVADSGGGQPSGRSLPLVPDRRDRHHRAISAD
jgi:hypothetical protein